MHKTSAGILSVFHNSDWSGMVKIGVHGNEQLMELPGPEFYALALRIALATLEDKVDDVFEGLHWEDRP